MLIGLLATTVVTGGDGAEGLLYGGPVSLLGKQAVGVVAVMVYSFVMAALLGLLIDKTVGFRVKPEAEVEGVDIHEHAESGTTSRAPVWAARAPRRRGLRVGGRFGPVRRRGRGLAAGIRLVASPPRKEEA